MTDESWYNEGARELQGRFDSRQRAERLAYSARAVFQQSDREFIARSNFFLLATADGQGAPDCSYKGGVPGFVRVVGESELAFPDYDGNGMFRSLGNLKVNPRVGLLFINFQKPRRLRVNGTARVSASDALMAEFPGAQLVVRVSAERIFNNCPRYVHRMEQVEQSPHTPQPPDAE